MKKVDVAMYHAKDTGRDSYQFFKSELNIRAMERQSLEESLRHAMERCELSLHYQPKMDLATGTIIGVEALIRWRHPQRGLVPRPNFIAIAEDCGLIVPIGRWVLREAAARPALAGRRSAVLCVAITSPRESCAPRGRRPAYYDLKTRTGTALSGTRADRNSSYGGFEIR